MTMESRLNRVLDAATESGRIVGAVVLVSRNGELVYERTVGLADRETSRPMTADTIFRLASVSKPYAAATALALCDRGVLALDEPITTWLPDFKPKLADGSTPKITLRHLLSHTSGLGYGERKPGDPYFEAGISGGLGQPGRDMEENLRRIASVPLYSAPGTAWRYGVSIDVAGGVIEAATGKRLGESVAELIIRPLGMTDTGFAITDRARLATPYAEGLPPNRMDAAYEVTGELGRGTYFDPSRCFDAASFHSGGAGMVGTAGDFMKLLEAFRVGGTPIMAPATFAEATRNQIGHLPREEKDNGWRFGLLSAVLADPAAANVPFSAGTMEWGGIYGHGWIVDRANGLSVASFTNTAVEGCLGAFPKDVRRAVYG